MDGVLEATISLFACKVLCGLLCLSVINGSVSSVSLCCSCLVLFTDLSITVFLTCLWFGVPPLLFFHPSADDVALRFVLFLGNTYGAVLLLTPPLVAVELLARLLWPQEVAGRGGKQENDVHAGETWEMAAMGAESGWASNAVGFLGCLLLWGVCGTQAVSSWRLEQLQVKACLERGSPLASCLPCLFFASSPLLERLGRASSAAALLLGLAPGLVSLAAGPTCARTRPELRAGVEQARPSRDAPALQLGPAGPPPQAPQSAVCCLAVDSDKTADTCSAPGHNNRQRPNAASADGRKLKSENISLSTQVQSEFPAERGGTESGCVHATPLCRGQAWQPQRGGVRWRLACAALVSICPTFFSTNTTLISSLDSLAVYVIQQLVTPPYNQELLTTTSVQTPE